MKKYIVYYSGNLIVEARNEQEAKGNACFQGIDPDTIETIYEYKEEQHG